VLSASSTCVGCQARVDDSRRLESTTIEYPVGGGGGNSYGYGDPYATPGPFTEVLPITVTRDFGQISTQAWSRATHGSLSTGIQLSTSPQPVQTTDSNGLPYLGATINTQASFSDSLTIRSTVAGGFGIARFKGHLLETFEGTPQERTLRLTMSANATGVFRPQQSMIFDKQVQGPVTYDPAGVMLTSGQVQRVTGGVTGTQETETFLNLGDDNAVYMDVVFRYGAPISISSTLSVFFDAISAESRSDMQSNYSVNAWWDGIESVNSFNPSTGQIGLAARSFTVTSTSQTAWTQSQYTPLVPEPSTVALVLSGALALGVRAAAQARRRLSRRPKNAGA
jgi:hypothetical protein